MKNRAGCESKLRCRSRTAVSFTVSPMIGNVETLLKTLLSHISSSAVVRKYCRSPWVFLKLLAPNCSYKEFHEMNYFSSTSVLEDPWAPSERP